MSSKTSSATQIAVLGLGNWGTALANHLAKKSEARKGEQVLGWSIDAPIVAGINQNNRNPLYLSEIALTPALKATSDLTATFGADVVLLVFPSRGLHEVLPNLKLKPGTIVVSAIKGIDPEGLRTPLQLARDYLGSEVKLAVISGPSFAKDVAAGSPCGIVAAASEEGVARTVADLFSGNGIKVYVSTDPLGVELGGILKNVIALAAGIGDGLGLGESARAGLITRGLAEMTRLAEAMGADVRTFYGLSGLGDLAMTATSSTSRNHQVGFRLGRGEKLEEILNSIGSVAEGVTTTPLVRKLAEQHQVDMPITLQVSEVLAGRASPKSAVQNLITRPTRGEF